ncbi:MAG TPA: methyltransferase [Anaerolineae bacterium]|nr:methyltransferase [Anaerolineae bacterium]
MTAFERVAPDYDRDFSQTRLARALRDRVWSRLALHVRPRGRVLEIGCGTGEDALWLAERGAQVLATDVSPAMLDITARKALTRGVGSWVETRLLDIARPHSLAGEELHPIFDGVLSNFGALNCARDLQPLVGLLRETVKPGGWLFMVFINRWCAWEILWHVLHLQPRIAFRRLRRGGVDARVGQGTVHVWYPSIASIRLTFAPAFRLRKVTGLGVCLPPSYLEPVVARRPRLFDLLLRFERAAAQVFPLTHLADHVSLEFERV